MKTYFRITAYNPTHDISFIIDSVDQYETIGQVCANILSHSCIIEGSSAEKFDDGNIPKATPNGDNFILRACMKGKVKKENGIVNINGRYYKPNKGK